jgi:hypothetical protein
MEVQSRPNQVFTQIKLATTEGPVYSEKREFKVDVIKTLARIQNSIKIDPAE